MSGYNRDLYMVDSNGCFDCEHNEQKVKGRFGLAWVSESPECPCPEPVGWQVEFHDTPSKVEQKCQEMVRWINCPPLPRCDPCPPIELCCQKRRCTCKKEPDPPCTCCSAPKPRRCEPKPKKCCCCGWSGPPQPPPPPQPRRCCGTPAPCSCRNRSPKRY